MPSMWACLVLSVLLGWGYIAGPRGGKAQQPGTPLTDKEYYQFFMLLQIARRANTACLLRELYGCVDPLVWRLDEYENHGAIPEGPICTALPEAPFFPDFCTFAFYRCTNKRLFIKRTECPREPRAELGNIRASNDMTTGSDTMVSGIFRPQPLFPMSPSNAQPAHSNPVAVIPSFSPKLRNMQLNPSEPRTSEVKPSRRQQGQLPSSDIQDLLLRLQDTNVKSSLLTLQRLLSMGKAVREEELQAASMKVMAALNNANILVGSQH